MPLRWASCLFRPARSTATSLEINPNACPPELQEQLSLRGTACLRPRGSHILYERVDDAGQGAFTPPVLIYIKRLSVCGGLDVCVKRTFITHFVSRAAREARLQVQLQHPHLLPALASVRGRHHYYLVLPAAEGDLWAEVEAMKQQGIGYTEGELREITRQILLGLEQLHSNNLAHRDIKPANLLRMPEGGVTIADFGCADGCTSGFVAAGTAQFQPPECRRNAGAQLAVLPKGYDQRMQDMWSVGATLASLWFAQLPEVIRGSGSSRVPGATAVAAAAAAAAAMRNESISDSDTRSTAAMAVPATAGQETGDGGVTTSSALLPPLPPFLAAAGFAACTSTVGARGEAMSAQLLDLLARLLRLRPSERLTVTQALRHSWLLLEEEVTPGMMELQPTATAAAELSPSPVSSSASSTDHVRTTLTDHDRFGPFLSHSRIALLPASASSPPEAILQPPATAVCRAAEATEAAGPDVARTEQTEKRWGYHIERQQMKEQNQLQDSRQSSPITSATTTSTAGSPSDTATVQSHSRQQTYSKGHSESPSVLGHCHSHDGSSPSSQTTRSPGEEAQLFALRQRQQQQQQSSWITRPPIQAQNPKRAQRAILRVFVGAGGESSGSN